MLRSLVDWIWKWELRCWLRGECEPRGSGPVAAAQGAAEAASGPQDFVSGGLFFLFIQNYHVTPRVK